MQFQLLLGFMPTSFVASLRPGPSQRLIQSANCGSMECAIRNVYTGKRDKCIGAVEKVADRAEGFDGEIVVLAAKGLQAAGQSREQKAFPPYYSPEAAVSQSGL